LTDLFVVPVMEPQVRPGDFNALNAAPNLPAWLKPNWDIGLRPFYAQGGIGVHPPSFLTSSESVSLSEPDPKACPPNFELIQPSSQQTAQCLPRPLRPVAVFSFPVPNHEVWDSRFPGYNPLMPPPVMPGLTTVTSQPSLLVVPSFREIPTQSQQCVNCEFA